MQSKISIRMIALILCFCLICPMLFSCASASGKDGKIHVVTTIFPLYDWLCRIVGENGNVEITMLLDNGVDLHSYQPNATDMVKISTCDLFLYVGGASDKWVDDALSESVNPDRIVIDLFEVLGGKIKTEEIVEGMEAEEEEEEEADEYDEHIWLSLRNAKASCRAITDAMKQIDPDTASDYEENYLAYSDELDRLDAAFTETVASCTRKTLLFGDRFPFRYLTEDYGLSYYAAFVGCSAETEASFETIVFLSGKADELGLHTILKLEGSNGKIAETIRSSSNSKNQQILTLDSMQSVTLSKVKAGATYLSLMEQNLSVLAEALR